MSRVLITSPLVSQVEDAEAVGALRRAGNEVRFNRRVLAGEPPLSVVNPAVLGR